MENSWCICSGQLSSSFEIQCDKCDKWYHGMCVGVTKKFSKVNPHCPWLCPPCSSVTKASSSDARMDVSSTNGSDQSMNLSLLVQHSCRLADNLGAVCSLLSTRTTERSEVVNTERIDQIEKENCALQDNVRQLAAELINLKRVILENQEACSHTEEPHPNESMCGFESENPKEPTPNGEGNILEPIHDYLCENSECGRLGMDEMAVEPITKKSSSNIEEPNAVGIVSDVHLKNPAVTAENETEERPSSVFSVYEWPVYKNKNKKPCLSLQKQAKRHKESHPAARNSF